MTKTTLRTLHAGQMLDGRAFTFQVHEAAAPGLTIKGTGREGSPLSPEVADGFALVKARGLVGEALTREEVKALKVGDFVGLTCSGSGDVDDVECFYQPGAVARVSGVDVYEGQGLTIGVTVAFGPGQFVYNAFDATDADAYPFAHVSPQQAALGRLALDFQVREDKMAAEELITEPDDYENLRGEVLLALDALAQPATPPPTRPLTLDASGHDNRTVSAILAGLSLLRDHAYDGYNEEPVLEMASDARGEPCEPLTADEITALIDSL